ncbi:MAG: hypothetical protein HY392_02435 [Candidatus Diapherotrites archaeon]|nr:hypothetical protein [Candidatus Diapherotrites archaeon]
MLFIYRNYLKDESVTPEKLIQETSWDGKRIDRAIKYLKDIGALDIILSLGNFKGVQNFIIRGLTPDGINIVENQKEFKHTFGFEVNLGLIKFSWNRALAL